MTLSGCQETGIGTETGMGSASRSTRSPTATPQPSRTATARATPTDVFEDVTLESSSPTATEPLVVRVTARNRTDERRPLRARLRLAGPLQTRWFLVEVPGVEPNGRRTAAVSLGVQPSAGPYELALPAYRARADVTIETATGEVGTQLESRDVSLTVRQPAVRLGDLVDGQLVRPGENRVFVTLPVEGGRDGEPLAPTAISVAGQRPITESRGLRERRYGAETDGQLLYELPRARLDGPVTANTSGTSKPEFRWTIDAPPAPSLEFVDSPVPEGLASGFSEPFSVMARNTGATPGVFAAVVRGPDGTRQPVGRTRIEPGETGTVETTVTQPTLGESTYAVETTAGSLATELTGEPVQRRLGERFETYAGLQATVGQITESFQTVTYETDAGTQETTAGDGRTFYAVRLSFLNTEPSPTRPVGADGLDAMAGSRVRWLTTDRGARFSDPIEGPRLDPDEPVGSQGSRTGWLLVEASARLSRANLSIQMTSTDPDSGHQRAAVWQPE